jgi:hypothetical protein
MSAGASAFDDQVDAAAKDARRVLDVAGDLLPNKHLLDAPGPYAAGVLADLSRTAPRRCRHLKSPAPCWIFGWRPGRLFCTRCAPAVTRAIAGTAEEMICDACRETAPTLITSITGAGLFLITAGLCAPCWEAETGHAAA